MDLETFFYWFFFYVGVLWSTWFLFFQFISQWFIIFMPPFLDFHKYTWVIFFLFSLRLAWKPFFYLFFCSPIFCGRDFVFIHVFLQWFLSLFILCVSSFFIISLLCFFFPILLDYRSCELPMFVCLFLCVAFFKLFICMLVFFLVYFVFVYVIFHCFLFYFPYHHFSTPHYNLGVLFFVYFVFICVFSTLSLILVFHVAIQF